ncbi:TonB-dependent receptor domain-containing protein [Marinicella meishanensis]|uniref:TonB-dependent receptor domain-containing protein n=1 Tax=Marinicella meishanensis TaxID=2873263 RepID=UPI001CC037F8|nr:TonB-dependent receptor [Marinicella sp. NBU2979]
MQLNGHFTDHQWQLGWHHSNHQFEQVGRNFFLHEATLAAVESGAFDLQASPASQAGVLDALRVTAYRESRHDQQSLYGQYTHQGMTLSGGNLTLTAKAEYRQEKYHDVHDPLSLAGQLNGGFDAVRNRHGKQSIADLSLLMQAPIHTQLTLDAGIRYSDSNRFKAAHAGHLSMTYQPWDSLQIHAAYSHDFNRPSLYQSPSNDDITTEDIIYPPICLGAPQPMDCYLRDVTVIDRFNASLKAEQADQWRLSINYQPTNQSLIQVSYVDSRIEDVIRDIPASYVVFANDVPDIIIPSGMGCADGVCVVGFGNVGQLDHQSVLLAMGFQADVFGGTYATNWQSVHVLEDRYVGLLPLSSENPRYYPEPIQDSGNRVGGLNQPKHRLQWRHSFGKNNWQLHHQINLVGQQDQLAYVVTSRTPTWVTHDVQFNHHNAWQGQLTLGIQNLLAKAPPLGQERFTAERYQTELYNPFGRIVYARYTQEF